MSVCWASASAAVCATQSPTTDCDAHGIARSIAAAISSAVR